MPKPVTAMEFRALELALVGAGKIINAVPDEVLVRITDEYDAFSKQAENDPRHTAWLRARTATYLAALEFARAFAELATFDPAECACPDCLQRRKGGHARG